MAPFWMAGHELSLVQLVVQMPNSFAIHQPIRIVHEPCLGRKVESWSLFLSFIGNDSHIPPAVMNRSCTQVTQVSIQEFALGGVKYQSLNIGQREQE